jgi:hypothetical protein
MMNIAANASEPSTSDEFLIDLISSEQNENSLDSLFTPLKTNDPVEQMVRRT